MKRRLTIGLVALLAAIACNEHGLTPLDEAIKTERQDTITQLETNRIDILWVIDSSGSMCEEQEALTSNFEIFIEGLVQISADFNMAVVTTDMIDDRGRFRTAPGIIGADCSGAVPLSCPGSTGPVLNLEDYRVDPNDPRSGIDEARLLTDFRCIATVGTQGSGFEKGLDSMRAALSDELLQTVNANFRRDGAFLAIIFVTDENDCSDQGALDLTNSNECEWQRDSLTQLDFYLDFMRSLGGEDELERMVVAGIIGPDNDIRVVNPDPPVISCTGETGQAFAGYRYEEFIEAFDDRGVVADICSANSFEVALDQISEVIGNVLAVKCLARAPRFCTTDADCSGGATCEDRGEPGGGNVCSDFEVFVDVVIDGQWVSLTPVDEFEVIYEADRCTTGLGIQFIGGTEPSAGDNFRIRYPIELDPIEGPVPTGTVE